MTKYGFVLMLMLVVHFCGIVIASILLGWRMAAAITMIVVPIWVFINALADIHGNLAYSEKE